MVQSCPPDDAAVHALYPFSLRVDEFACMLNFEFADHEVYDGAELQWFDDAEHGTGMLAFLSRRDGRIVDYYVERGLRPNRDSYEIAGGTGSWSEIDFDVATLVVADDGVAVDVRFTDLDGRSIEICVSDRDGKQRRSGGLLAPVGAGVEHPASLLLVWMPRFDLVRATTQPVIRIDGIDAPTGRLPGRRLHRRHLIKYAAPVVTVEFNRCAAGEVPVALTAAQREFGSPDGLGEIAVKHAGHRAVLRLDPNFPDVRALADGVRSTGRWHLAVDRARLTGGRWSAERTGVRIEVALDVDERWKPGRLPWLMRIVTTVVPVFRRWPTTYRWRAEVLLATQPAMTGLWERTTTDGARSYRRATTRPRRSR